MEGNITHFRSPFVLITAEWKKQTFSIHNKLPIDQVDLHRAL